jgi:hypothetical protein
MKLREVLNTLNSAELNNLSLFNKDTGEILPGKLSMLITSINLGLTDLHTRFLLKIGTIIVDLNATQMTYPLLPIYQVGNKAPVGTVQYIRNDGIKFKDNLLKIQQVFDDQGHELGLNDHNARRGVFCTSSNVLQVPQTLTHECKIGSLKIVYRMNAAKVQQCDDDVDIDCVDVDLDYTHLWALCLFVASRLHNPSGFGTGGVHEGNNYWGKYEAECARLDATNMRLDYIADNTKRLQKGFP